MKRLCLLLLLSGCLLACVPKGGVQDDPQDFWSRPKAMPLYRGIVSGLSPQQTWLEICRRWSFGGRCAAFKPLGKRQFLRVVGRKQTPGDLKLFSYFENDGPFPCKYVFFFRRWGLTAIRSYCSPHNRKQTHALVKRYFRSFGKARFRRYRRQKLVYMWETYKSTRRVLLLLLSNGGIIGVHQDLRLTWTRYIDKLRPALNSRSSLSWKNWRTIPVELRYELLEQYSRTIERLEQLLRLSPLVRIRTTPWPAARSCEPLTPQQWMRKHARIRTWKTLRFIPQRPLRLQYRWYTRPGSIFSRTFKLQARGCGYHFSIILDQSGRNLHVQRLYFKRVKSK